MKKTKRKILIITGIILITLIYTIIKMPYTTSISINSIEAMASGEEIKYDCDVNPGFCIINGIAQPGVTYKE